MGKYMPCALSMPRTPSIANTTIAWILEATVTQIAGTIKSITTPRSSALEEYRSKACVANTETRAPAKHSVEPTSVKRGNTRSPSSLVPFKSKCLSACARQSFARDAVTCASASPNTLSRPPHARALPNRCGAIDMRRALLWPKAANNRTNLVFGAGCAGGTAAFFFTTPPLCSAVSSLAMRLRSLDNKAPRSSKFALTNKTKPAERTAKWRIIP
mmetsp:Transcript_72598/g.235882  ORF Transcript_72598/g.235882 Transcript_72598/m.235882 type:complete len:215 (-) Transcript_72598:7122-7766(-)